MILSPGDPGSVPKIKGLNESQHETETKNLSVKVLLALYFKFEFAGVKLQTSHVETSL